MRTQVSAVVFLILSFSIQGSAQTRAIVTGWVDTVRVVPSSTEYSHELTEIVPADRAPRLTVSLMSLDRTRDPLRPVRVVQFNNSRWWESVRWRVRADAIEQVITASEGRLLKAYADSQGFDESSLASGQTRFAQFELPKLAPGIYTIITELTLPFAADGSAEVIVSDPYKFSVRTGHEDKPTRIALLEKQARDIAATPSGDRYQRFRATMTELLALEPGQPNLYEFFADIATGAGALDDAVDNYRRAVSVMEAGIVAHYGSVGNAPKGQVTLLDRARATLAAFERARKETAVARTMIVPSERFDGRKQFVIYRAGQRLNVIEATTGYPDLSH